MAARTSCGVLVTDGARLLLGRATGSFRNGAWRWDIPKGLLEPGEDLAEAAIRELLEETGLRVDRAALDPLGVHAYLPSKSLALFRWRVVDMPDPATLHCAAMVVRPGRSSFPEFDRFAVLPWDEALACVGRNLARVLSSCPAGLP